MGLELAPGVIIAGRYQLERIIGQGGMGVVWAATHMVTRKRVALKLVKGPVQSQPELRGRFLREARAATAVEHPNVLDVHDVFELDDATPVMVMDLLRGETLGERIAREGKLSLEDTANVFVQVVSGVGKAHAVDVVHRDLKPDNIFLVQSGSGPPSVRILDFGIAKLVGNDELTSENGVVTGTGTMLGTPRYMSPEQTFGEKSIDCRTDIWSLGAILYECLTGCRPVEGDSVGQVVKQLLSNGITPIETILPSLPPEVAELVGRMLSRDRDKRPADLREVMRVLGPYASVHLPLPDFGPPGSERVAQSTFQVEYGAPEPERPPAPNGGGSSIGHTSSVDSVPRSEPTSLIGRATGAFALAAIAASIAGVRWLNASESPPVSASLDGPAAPMIAAPASELPTPPMEALTQARAPGALATAHSSGPRSCAEVRSFSHVEVDGTYEIDPDGPGPFAPFAVYCDGMGDPSRAPVEYIPLVHGAATGEPDANATTHVWSGGPCRCPNVTRHFTKVRLDPTTMMVDVRDGRFAVYSRDRACEAADQNHCGSTRDLSWGSAGSCRADMDTSGRGSIDLRGTPFSVAFEAGFTPTGHGAAGRASFSEDRKVVTLSGGGLCGSLVSTTAPRLHLSRDR